MMWGYHDGSGWWMLFGGMSMIVFWGALIWFAVFAVRSLAGDRRVSDRIGAGNDAEAIARRRFASGEISEEEFQRILAALHRQP
ncbi:MAG: SHOCT domain-containing protein [Chloroflexi bacterium]|nr:SHOCT domain-containing protein [Chloroflexota bacterium]